MQPNKPEVATFVNGPSTKSVMYVATTMAQSNGTIMQTVQTAAGKKIVPQALPPHAVFGTVRFQKKGHDFVCTLSSDFKSAQEKNLNLSC